MKKLFTVKSLIFLLAGLFIFPAFAQNDYLQIRNIQGLVQIQSFGQEQWIKAQDSAKLFSGDKIRTFLESAVTLIYPDASEFSLGENSFLEIKDISQNPRKRALKQELKINLGTLHYKVTPIKEKTAELKIHSSTAIVGVTGTEGVIRAKGEAKPTENILIEGTTFNSDDEDSQTVVQKQGNICVIGENSMDLFSADASKEAQIRMKTDDQTAALFEKLIASYEKKKNEGYAVYKLEGSIREISALMEAQEYEPAKKLLSKADEYLERAEKTELLENFQPILRELRQSIAEKQKQGFDAVEVYLLLEQAEANLQKSNRRSAENLISLIRQKLTLLSEQGEGFLQSYEKTEQALLQRAEMGFSVGEIKEILRESYIFYKNNDLARAYKLLGEADDQLALTSKELPVYLEDKVSELEAAVIAKKKDGYLTDDLELQIERIKKLFKSGSYIKAKIIIKNLENGLLSVTKKVPLDLELRISRLKEEVNYKKSLGFDLNTVQDSLGELENYEQKGDVKNLERICARIENSVKELKLPAGFGETWKQFLKEFDQKESLGFDVRGIKELKEGISSAIEKGDINLARSFLQRADNKLKEIKDVRPPVVQILSFSEDKGKINIEGLAADNARLKSVYINNNLVDFSAVGKFSYETVSSAMLNKVVIVAEDISGNRSPALEIAVKSKSAGLPGKIRPADLEYYSDSALLRVDFTAGGKIKAGGQEGFCDSKGKIRLRINPKATAGGNIVIEGWNPDGTQAESVSLNTPDKWSPELEINRIYFSENIAPALNLNPLEYKANSIVISGKVEEKILVMIEGRVFDSLSGIKQLTIFNRPFEFGKEGDFTASFSVSLQDVLLPLHLEDCAGNIKDISVPLDIVKNSCRMTVNNKTVVLDSLGQFLQEVALSDDLKEMVVECIDSTGKILTSQRLLLAKNTAPDLEISSLIYTADKVTVSGKTDPGADVYDESGSLSAKASSRGVFSITAVRPDKSKEYVFKARPLAGIESKGVKIIFEPLIDKKPPRIFLSQPGFKGKKVVVEGFVEDDTSIESLTIQGQEVKLNQGKFSQELPLPDKPVIEVVAKDISGKIKREILVIEDTQPPELTVESLAVNNGRLLVSGFAVDNIAVKEIRVNKIPVKKGSGQQRLDFSYDTVLTEDLKKITIYAVDFYGNDSAQLSREVEIPGDNSPPQIKLNDLKYGSPIVYISGKIEDPAGIKAVYVQGRKADVFGDGSFKARIEVEVDSPSLTLEKPSYEKGTVTVIGKVNETGFSPPEAEVEAEDLWGNRNKLFTAKVEPFKLREIKIFVDGRLIDFNDNGSFSAAQIIVYGKKVINIEAVDPFGNTFSSDLELETTPPILEVNELEYLADEKIVVVSGKAEDSQSGIYSIDINGIKVDFNQQGKFSYRYPLSEGTLVITSSDYAGNRISLTKEVIVPDTQPPVFTLNVQPMPAIIGNPVSIEITALDGGSGLPENLQGIPKVTAVIDGKEVVLNVEGEGSKFIATLNTGGFQTALVEIGVEGKDSAGNISSRVEGINTFTLIAKDEIAPNFSLETVPAAPVLGRECAVRIFCAEILKTLPELEVELTSGEVKPLNLVKIADREFESRLNIPLDLPLGEIVFRLKGGEDLSGNKHNLLEKKIALTIPSAEKGLPLNINFMEFLPDKFILEGVTSSSALIHLEFFKFIQDIVAGEEGKFRYEQYISRDDLQQLYSTGKVTRVKIKTKNYAGFESAEHILDVPLPPLLLEKGEYFIVKLTPSMVEQGGILNIHVEPLQPPAQPLQALIYLPGGKTESVVLTGQYKIPQDSPPGRAMFETVSGSIRQSNYFEIVFSAAWQKILNKDGFYFIKAFPDPMVLGQETEFIVNTQGDLKEPPLLELLLPDSRKVSVPLTGSAREFRGKYLCPENIPSGKAEIILNSGTAEEIRRPFGVAGKFMKSEFLNGFLVTNPAPLVSGSDVVVKISFPGEIPFLPRLALVLSNGESININLTGKTPSNRFETRFTLNSQVPTGLATFVVKDDRDKVINSFPSQIVPSWGSKRGMEAFVFPDILRPLGTATVQLNASSALNFNPKAAIAFPDGRKLIIPLEGQNKVYKGNFIVPVRTGAGMATIEIFDDKGSFLSAARAMIATEDAPKDSTRIFIEPANFALGDKVRVVVETTAPFNFLPKAALVHKGGLINIVLQGSVPGNRFEGNFIAPQIGDERPKLEIRDDKGNLLGELGIESDQGKQGNIVLQPMPPVLGKPLAIRVTSPYVIDFYPTLRLIFSQGTKDLKLYGGLPGDSFTASLERLDSPLKFVEILDKQGNSLIKIPVEFLGEKTPLDFNVEPVSEIIPGQTLSLSVRSTVDIPFIPRLRLDFSGKIIDVPLNGVPFSREFIGKCILPNDVSWGSVKAVIFDPEGRLIWQRVFMEQGKSQGMILNVVPSGTDSFEIFWDRLAGASFYELRYGQDSAMKQKIEISGQNRYLLSGLEKGKLYYFQITAFDRRREKITQSPVISSVCSQTHQELFVQDIFMGKDVHLIWGDYPGADSYRVNWGYAPGNYSGFFETNQLSFMIKDIIVGRESFIKVFALKQGKIIGESREIAHYPRAFMPVGLEIMVNPDPPQTAASLNIMLHFFDDINFLPKVFVRFTDGSTEILQTSGEKRDFRTILSADKFRSDIAVIDVEDNQGRHIGDRPFKGGTAGKFGPKIEPYPPVVGKPFTFTLDTPMVVPLAPKINLRYQDGTSKKLDLQGNLPGNKFSVYISNLEKPLAAIDIIDPFGQVVDTVDFSMAQDFGQRANILIFPDPPVMGQNLNVKVEFPEAVNFKPKVFFEFIDGFRKEVIPGQGPGVSVFEVMLPGAEFTRPLRRIEVKKDWEFIADKFLGAGSGPMSMVNIMVNPDPPQTGQNLEISLNFLQDITFLPRVLVRLSNGTTHTPVVTGSIRNFKAVLTADKFSNSLMIIDVEDDKGMHIGERFFGEHQMNFSGSAIKVDPYPPIIGQPLYINVEIPMVTPVAPSLRLRYKDGAVQDLPLQGILPTNKFSANLARLDKELQVIELVDPFGQVRDTLNFSFSGSSGCSDVYLSPSGTGNLNVSWNSVPQAVNYQIWYGSSSGNYNEPDSPRNVGSVTSYTLTGLIDGKEYYLIVKAFDINGTYICSTVERSIFLSSSAVPYPTDIWSEPTSNPGEAVIRWNSVSGISGYKVYFGKSSRSYTESGSPVYMYDPSTTRVVISGLINGAGYYFTVTCVANDGKESSFSPKEVQVFPGGSGSGSGSIRISSPSNPENLDFQQVNLGQNTETLYVTIQNLATTAVEVKTKMNDLMNALDMVTTISSSNIYISSSSFTIAAGSSVQQSIYISVPSTGVNPGDYASEIVFYNDANNNGIQDTAESFAVLHVWMMFGAAGLELQGADHIEFGYTLQGDTTDSLGFSVKNTGSFNYANLKTILPTMVKFPDRSSTIPSANITCSIASTLNQGNQTAGSVQVSVPAAGTALGEYGGMLAVYNDTNGDNDLDGDEPLETLPMHLYVVGAGGLQATSLIVGEDTVFFGTTDAGGSLGKTMHVENHTSNNYPVKVIKNDLTISGGYTINKAGISLTVPFNLGPDSQVDHMITINVPANTAPGIYTSQLKVYADRDSDNNCDSDEPYDITNLQIMVRPKSITSITAANRGTGGTVDLYWVDPNPNTDYYKIYYRDFTLGQPFNYAAPNRTATQTAVQITGLTNGDTYDFVVRCVKSGIEDFGITAVSAGPTISGTDITAPTFAGIKRAYSNGQSGKVVLEWELSSDKTLPITYIIDYNTNPDVTGAGSVNTTSLSSTGDTITGLTNSTVYYFRVRAQDNVSPTANRDSNNKIETATPYGGVHHIAISGAGSSQIGKPVLIQLKAEDASNNLVAFNDSVNISVNESSSKILNSWILSVQDRMTGNLAEVEMSGGVGYFTVDALESERISIQTMGIQSGQSPYGSPGLFNIDFAPSVAGAGIISFLIDGPALAMSGTGPGAGAFIRVSAIDGNDKGKVVTNYTGTVNLNISDISSTILMVSDGGGSLSGQSYTFNSLDKGEVIFQLQDTETETVTLTASDGSAGSNTYSVNYLSVVGQFILKAGGTFDLSYEALGSRAKYTAYAFNSAGDKLIEYNGQATWAKTIGQDTNNSCYASPNPVQFTNGVAEFYVEDSEYESVTFNLDNFAGAVSLLDLTVTFQPVDSSPPQVTNVVAETPYLVHVYFNEDIDSGNALIENNYQGIGTINKVCWYEDNVTLHLGNPGMTLGSNQSLTITGTSPSGIKDKDGNFMGNSSKSFTVPDVDYQGQANPGGDWFEIQLTQYSIPGGTDTTIGVTVYHKNACGYLTGSNRVNARTDIASATVSYDTSAGGTLVSGPTDVNISSGTAGFNITVNCNTGTNIKLSVSAGSVTTLVPATISGP